jgi:hypothetical protein
MRHQQHQVVDPRRCRRPTKVRGPPRAPENLQECQRPRSLMGALLMMTTTSPCALLFSQGNASSRALLAKGAQEVFINARRKDATVQSHITFALTQTDMRWMRLQFHIVQLVRQRFQQQFHMVCRIQQWFHMTHLPFLWSYSQEKGPCQKQPCKPGCVW